jgi:hypothetical protein
MKRLERSDWDLLDVDSLIEHKDYMEVNEYKGNEMYIDELNEYIDMAIEGILQ